MQFRALKAIVLGAIAFSLVENPHASKFVAKAANFVAKAANLVAKAENLDVKQQNLLYLQSLT